MEELKKKIDKLVVSSKANDKKKKKKKKNKKKNKNKDGQEMNLNSGVGSIRLKRKEMLTAVTGDDAGGYAVLRPSSTVMTFLHSLSNCFTEIKYHSLTIHYVASCGTTTDGLVTVGFKAGTVAAAAENTVTKIASLSPSLSTPVWSKGSFSVPRDRLMTRKTYVLADIGIDGTPGSLLWLCSAAKAKAAGALWISYDVTLLGPKL